MAAATGTLRSMDQPARRVSAAAARRFLVRRQLLAPPRSLPASLDGVRAVFERLGSVQFDPLGVAGRNHDLVLHARVAGYRPAWADTLLYDTRELYESYNKGLSLVPTADLPWYRIQWQRALLDDRVAKAHERRETMEHVLEEIRRRGPLSTDDFERHRTAKAVDWFWGPTNEIRAVLEALWEAGVLALHHRAGNRRYYDLAERIYSPELLAEHHDPVEQRTFKLLSRYRAHGLLGTGGQAELWLGTATTKPVSYYPSGPFRDELRGRLIDAGALVPVEVENVRGMRYAIAADVAALDAAIAERDDAPANLDGPPSATFVAPLDPFAWDRDLMAQLFGFEYIWEVYVPEQKRRWGYYVLPLLFDSRIVGRIEPRIDRAAKTVRILGIHWEKGFDPARADGFIDAMRSALADYLRFGGATRVEWSATLGRERRLFGTQPARAIGRQVSRSARPGTAGTLAPALE
jgi:uncharacterized protein YcaQ